MSRWRKKAVYKVELLEGREKKTKGFWGKLGDEVIPTRWNKKGQISQGLEEKDY